MDKYIVIIPHSNEDCLAVLKQVEAIGAITHFDWGCKDGDHTGWAVLEASNKAEAMMSVPTLQRSKARVIKLTSFTPEDIRSLHE